MFDSNLLLWISRVFDIWDMLCDKSSSLSMSLECSFILSRLGYFSMMPLVNSWGLMLPGSLPLMILLWPSGWWFAIVRDFLKISFYSTTLIPLEEDYADDSPPAPSFIESGLAINPNPLRLISSICLDNFWKEFCISSIFSFCSIMLLL